jgi:phytoene/squalene synthetase
MKLHEIIDINDIGTDSILTEELYKYRKSLFVYYSNFFTSEPVLMVTDVFNAAQYALIVPIDEMSDAQAIYLQDRDCSQERELINYQSVMLSDWIK